MEASTSTSPAAETALRDFEALSRHDADTMKACYADDAVIDLMPLRVLRGSEELRQFFLGMFAAIPDLEATYEVAAASDDTAVIEWRMRCTFTGSAAFQGCDPTGKR